jgi:hypothetical protein
VGHALEIVPESAPSGGGIAVQVLVRGKPGAGVPVEVVGSGGRKSAGVSGADGRLSFKMGGPGVYRIVAAVEAWRASFTFELK